MQLRDVLRHCPHFHGDDASKLARKLPTCYLSASLLRNPGKMMLLSY